MKSLPFGLRAALPLLLCALTGCESTYGGSVSTGVYYGVGLYDPWYYGGYDDDIDIIITPPDRPGNAPRPEHPIANPSPRPSPSIPSAPRPRPSVGRRR